MNKTFFIIWCLACCPAFLMAQQPTQPLPATVEEEHVSPFFRHVDIGVTAGSLGVGLEVAAPLTSFLDVRTGFTYMPHFKPKMDFEVQVYDKDGKPNESRFNKMADEDSRMK